MQSIAVVSQATSAILILINNYLAVDEGNLMASAISDDETINTDESYWTFQKWNFSDFTPWAFVSALLWVPGGTAGVYAIRRSGLAISVGIWSCVIVILSFIWGVLIFGEKQRSALGAVGSVTVLCLGLCGIAYFSSVEMEIEDTTNDQTTKTLEQGGDSIAAGEKTPLLAMKKCDHCGSNLDLEHFPHCGTHPHSHEIVDLHLPKTSGEQTLHISRYHIGLFMAVVNGAFAATIMVPLHYAPPNTTHGVGYSMSFGIAAVIVVALFWVIRFLFAAIKLCIFHSSWSELNNEPCAAIQDILQILLDSFCQGYQQLPSFHMSVMWKPGLTSGVLYSMGNLSGIVAIQNLGNFMGYSLGQSSMIVSGE